MVKKYVPSVGNRREPTEECVGLVVSNSITETATAAGQMVSGCAISSCWGQNVVIFKSSMPVVQMA
jgi:hypothetical protein